MDNDRRKIELMNSLLLSFPGTPIIYYGDEIGMGDNIYLGDRNGVRTPMQWTSDRNGGFSRCDPAKLYLPTIMDPVYGYQAVNVEAQSRSLASLLSWTKRLIAIRKSMRVFGRGTMTFIRPANRAVLVYVRQYEDQVLLCVANLSRSAQAAEIDLAPWRGRIPREMLGRTRFPRIGDGPYVVTLAPYGFFWFELREEGEPIGDLPVVPPEFVTLVVGDSWNSLVEGRQRWALERDALPTFLAGRRWFGDKGSPLLRTAVQDVVVLDEGNPGTLLALVEVASGRGVTRYALPLAINWTRFDRLGHLLSNVVAAVRRGAREGSLIDVCTEREFVSLLLRNIHAARKVESGTRRIEFRPTAAFARMEAPAVEAARPVDREQSNTTVIADAKFVVKMFRRMNGGIHPEIEIGRFLTDIAGYAHVPPLLGSVELFERDECSALAVVHGFIENQGDAWSVTSAYLDRYIDEQRVLAPDAPAESTEQASYLLRMRQIGRRTAELHNALASRREIAEFAPEPINADDVTALTESLVRRAQLTLDELSRRRSELGDALRGTAERLLAQRDDALAKIGKLLWPIPRADKIRHHGDFHLGQMLFAKDDVFVIDFEGEPQRSLTERRRKAPVMRDVAGLLRSIDYSVTAAFERALQTSPDEHGRLLHALEAWGERSADTFLHSYREALGPPARLWPESAEEAERLLQFFLLEKAFYEVDYELANRPAWLRVPLMGIQRVLSLART
jgi:maltose alpha-D-glucosyltransferase/alpha-amylase